MSALGGGFRSPSTPSRNRPHGNLAALRIAVIVLFGILTAQLFNMQILQGSDYARRSRENHLTRKEILPPRGLILDRNGTPLVRNVGIYTAVITPTFLPEEPEARYALYLERARVDQYVADSGRFPPTLAEAGEVEPGVVYRSSGADYTLEAKDGAIELILSNRMNADSFLGDALVRIPKPTAQ